MVQALFTLAAAGMFYVRHPVRTFKLIMGSISKRLRKSNPSAPIAADVDLAASIESPGNGEPH